jgi:type II secretory pathway component PulF
MTEFRYLAARMDGRLVRGVLIGASGTEVDTALRAHGLHPISTSAVRALRLSRRKPTRRDLAIAFRSLASLVNGGVSLVRALAVAQSLPRSISFRRSLIECRRYVIEGKTLTEALELSLSQVPAVVLGMLRAGERASKLGEALDQTASHLEQEAELAGRLQQALAYPAVLLVAGVSSIVVITVVVIPRFASILGDLGQQLPGSTRALLFLSNGLRDHGWLATVAGTTGCLSLWSWISTAGGRRHLHRLLLRLPIIGRLRHGFATARVAKALSGLLRTGVPILAALTAARQAAGDAEVDARLQRSGERIARGETVAGAFTSEYTLTPVALQLVVAGESSGQLAGMLERVAGIAALEAEGSLRTTVSLLEPALVVVFGGMVAFTAVALLQAVYSLRPG